MKLKIIPKISGNFAITSGKEYQQSKSFKAKYIEWNKLKQETWTQ